MKKLSFRKVVLSRYYQATSVFPLSSLLFYFDGSERITR